jgi:hypothetical protein
MDIFLIFLIGGKDLEVCSNSFVIGILDMRKGKHSLHFLVNDELIPHAIINIPNNEKMHIGVFFYFILYYFNYLFISIYNYYYYIL